MVIKISTLNPLIIALFAVILCLPTESSGQHIYRSQVTVEDIALLGSGPLLSLTAVWIESTPNYHPARHDQKERPSLWFPFDTFAENKWSPTASFLSDIGLGVSIITPLLMLLNEKAGDEAGVILLMYSEASSVTIGFTNITKSLARRPRPFVHYDLAPLEDKLERDAYRSFFSGHTSLSFMGAALTSTLAGEYMDRYAALAISVSSFAVATATAFLRIEAGKHYPSDIIAGALVGTLVGYTIPAIRRKDDYSGPPIIGTSSPMRINLLRIAF